MDHAKHALAKVPELTLAFWIIKIAATTLGGRQDNHLSPVSATPQARKQLAVATYNVENLAPSDPDSKYAALAQGVVTHLASPDVVAQITGAPTAARRSSATKKPQAAKARRPAPTTTARRRLLVRAAQAIVTAANARTAPSQSGGSIGRTK